MGIEKWGSLHPVTLAFVLALVASFGLSPFSNDLRAMYSALPKGVRAVRRVSLLTALRRAHLQLEDPTTVLRQLIVRGSLAIVYGTIALVIVMRTENRKFDLEFHAPLSTAEKVLGNSRLTLGFLLVICFTVLSTAIVSLFTVWQYRRPLEQVEKLKRKLGPLSGAEERLARMHKYDN